MIYYIVDWDRHFEKQRKDRPNAKHSWVAVPNKHDGKNYRRLMRRPNGPAMYAAWVLLLAVASKCPTRGRLVDDDGPLTPEDLEIKTDCPSQVFKEAIPILISLGWMGQLDDDCLPIGSANATIDTHCHPTEPEPDLTNPTDKTEPEEFVNVGDSDSDSPNPGVLFGLTREHGFIHWTRALTPLIGLENGARHPPKSKKYNADITCMGRWFDQYVWPDGVADAVGRSNLAIAVERAAAAQRSGKNPMAYLSGLMADCFSDQGMPLPDH